MKQGAELIDVRARHRVQPETFDLPSERRIQEVAPGALVKIGVTFPPNRVGIDGERFWVEVTRRDGDRLVGRIDNDLFNTDDHGLRLHDEVAFHVGHILDTDTFDYLAAVDYMDADENTPSQVVIGVAGKYTRLWIRVGEEEMGTALGPGRQELDSILDALTEARRHLPGAGDGKPNA